MPISAGVGGSASKNSFQAGSSAAAEALAGRVDPALVLVFATAGHDQDALLAGVTSVTGAAPLSGCSGAGVIGQDGSSEASHAVRVMALWGGALEVTCAFAPDAGADPKAAAESLAATLGAHEPRVVLLFPDGLTINTTALLRELHPLMPDVPLVGGTAGEMLRFERTFQYHAGKVYSGGVAAVALGGAIDVALTVTHGCDLLGIEHEVTRAEGATVYEIDGRPAWDVMREYLDEPGEDLSASSMPFLCFAQRAPGSDDDVVIRVPLALDRSNGSLFFPGELKTGERITMARRRRELISLRAVAAAREVLVRAGRTPALILQFDCTGRGRILYGDRVTRDLIEPVQQVVGKHIPWIGFHSYGEIAPIAGTPVYHNYTMALCAIVER